MKGSDFDFQEIYESFQPRILRYLTRLVGENEAEDLTQEVFVKIGQALENFRGDSQLSTWVYRIATNTAMDKLRSSAFKHGTEKICATDSVEEHAAELEDRNAWTGEKALSIEKQFVRQEMNDCLQSFIARLDENYRTVLVLSEFEGLRNKEIAQILGVSLDTVKIRLHRAKEKLKQDLIARCDAYWIEDNEFLPDLKRASQKPHKTSS